MKKINIVTSLLLCNFALSNGFTLITSAETIQNSIPEVVTSSETVDSIPEDTASSETVDSIPEDTASSETVDSIPEDTASSETVDSISEETTSSETVDSSSEDTTSSETVHSSSEDTASSETVESSSEDTASSETVESSSEDTASSKTTESSSKATTSSKTTESSSKTATSSKIAKYSSETINKTTWTDLDTFDFNEVIEYVSNNKYTFSKNVLRWRSLVESEAKKQGMEDYVPLILALIQVESGGRGTKDIMQSSESAGYSVNYWSTEEKSVKQGIKYLKSIIELAKKQDKGYEKDVKLIAQSYNFGINYVNYYIKNKEDNKKADNLDLAEEYSKTVVATSLGNHTAKKYRYINDVSTRLKKQYLYLNGGNFMYGEIISEYVGTGDSAVLSLELGKTLYNGECYGLTAWYVDKMGGPKLMGSGFMNAWSIGSDYNWKEHGWKVIYNPSFDDLQAGDVINWKAGGSLAPGTYGHTGVISSVGKNGDFKTYEQNAEKGKVNSSYNRNYSMNPIISIVRKVK